jgi:hypothetical protein
VAMDDAEARRQLEGTGSQRYGRPLPDLLAELAAAEAMDTRKRADYEADQARRDARAAKRAVGSGSGELSPDKKDQAINRISLGYKRDIGDTEEPWEMGRGAIAAQDAARLTGADSDRRLADAALLRGYARALNPKGPMSDEDAAAVVGRLPGVAGTAQSFSKVLLGSGVLTDSDRKFIRADMERRLDRIGKKRENAAARARRRATALGIDPSDVIDEPEPPRNARPGPSEGVDPNAEPNDSEIRVARVKARKTLGREPTPTEILNQVRINRGM